MGKDLLGMYHGDRGEDRFNAHPAHMKHMTGKGKDYKAKATEPHGMTHGHGLTMTKPPSKGTKQMAEGGKYGSVKRPGSKMLGGHKMPMKGKKKHKED
jgi:hypothetical protein